MMRIVLLFAAVVAAASAVPQPRADCYAEDPSPYLYFGSKTSYQFIGNSNVDPISLPGRYLLFFRFPPVTDWIDLRNESFLLFFTYLICAKYTK